MVSSPNYDRLKTFMETARVNKDLSAWDKDHEKAVQGFEKTIEDLHAYRDSHGFVGVTGKAMDRWVEDSVKRIAMYKEAYERGYQKYCRGRGVMATALAEGEKLSADLIDAATEAMRDDWVVSVPDREPGPGIRFMGKLYTTGAAYVEAVETQANEQREAAAKRIIDMFNDRAKIIERIEKKCTLASADVKAVVDALEVEIIDCLQQGRSIRLGDLGSFRPSLRCGKGVKEEQSVSPAMIKRVHIVFHPSSRIRRALSVKDHAVSFYRRDKKKKGDGTNQPGTTPPGTNPAGTGGVPSGTGGNPSGTPTPGGTPVPTGGTAVPAPAGTGSTGGNPSGTPTPGGTPVATGGTAVPAPGGMPTVAPSGH